MTRLPCLLAGAARLLALVVLLSTPAGAQELVVAPDYDAAGSFHNGLAPVAKGEEWGLIDPAGAWVVPPRFARIAPGGDGLFAVLEGGRWGYIDSTGKTVIAPAFSEAGTFLNGVAAVRDRNGWSFIRPNGRRILPQSFDETGTHDGFWAPVRDAEGWAVISLDPKQDGHRIQVSGGGMLKQGYRWVWDLEPVRLYSYSEDAIVAAFDDGERLLTFVHNDLKYTSASYPGIRRQSDGMSAVSTGPDQWGYLHRSGTILWEGQFEDALAFADGYAPVKQGGLWGYIAKNGTFVVAPQYDAAHPFRDGYAVIRKGDLRGFLRIDPEGSITEIVAPRFEDANRFSEGLAAVKTGGKWGFITDPDFRPLTEGETFTLLSE